MKGQTWFTKSVGINVAGASARWGLVRQRYDFTADQAKIDYTRILGANTVLEVGAGVFDSHEDGPPEDDDAARRACSASSFPALANLPQFAAMHNPLEPDSQGDVGQLPEQRQRRLDPERHLRQPLADHRPRHRGQHRREPDAHARRAHLQDGVMRERENFGQARSGHLRRRVQLLQRHRAIPNNTGFAFSNALLGQVTTYTESMGRVGDNRRQTTYAWYAQDTWKVHPDVTLDIGLRMYKSDLAAAHQRRVVGLHASTRSIRAGAATRRCCSGRSRRRRAGARVNPLTGEIVPGAVHRADGARAPATPAA